MKYLQSKFTVPGCPGEVYDRIFGKKPRGGRTPEKSESVTPDRNKVRKGKNA